ncbi:FAD-dependent oxidoreductase [Streptomyces sp. ACA25]|uniref:FAD-dependent oxidoreductase n=1 Tax=Streptomyces sp. ACA25 TaxID=3022596 RepID=UPI002308030D|nr:FAD-dependent oxidoreductase [Streptomyces sp. ACA25]MDB1088567.1 FAD-dependent oxidoreductase [Streptomyces sp. ACA25]
MTTQNRQIPAVAVPLEERRCEVVVIGGGAAGLSGALTLARARRSVTVIDAGQPRNAPAAGVHTYLTREGMPPGELLAAGRAEVTGYGGEVLAGTAVAAERCQDGGFRVRLEDGTVVLAGRLLVTTGLADELPEVPGVAERWGREVLHCPYCHGWEVRDRAIGVLATTPLAVHQALMWRQWSEDVTLFLHTAPEPTDEEYEQLTARGVAIVGGEVARLDVTGGRLTGVVSAGGRVVPVEAVVVAPRFTARTGLLAGLGLHATEQERNGQVIGSCVAADPAGATSVPGVWVAGNVSNVTDQVIGAAAAGVRAGAAINADLTAEDVRRAVAARRAAPAPHAAEEGPELPRRDTGENQEQGETLLTGEATRRGTAEEFWEDRYRSDERVWSGRPNADLLREATGLLPGRALDLGCGEGADAIWLAEQGWHVTAVDISRTALTRGAAQARAAGVADRIDWQRHDLAESFPPGRFDLVSAHFLHSPVDLPGERILRTAAAAVSPGGVLLVVGHSGPPPWDTGPRPDMPLRTAGEVVHTLGLHSREWELLVNEGHERSRACRDGRTVIHTDYTLKFRRLPG